MAQRIRMITWAEGAGRALEGGLEELLHERRGLYWIDIEYPTEADLDRLAVDYGGPKVRWADAARRAMVPKAQTYPDFVFIVWFVLEKFVPGKNVDPAQVFLFMTKDHLVTVHRNPVGLLDQVWEAFTSDLQMMAKSG